MNHVAARLVKHEGLRGAPYEASKLQILSAI